MFIDNELTDASTINGLNSTLKYVASDAHINEYDRNLNGMSANDLIQRFSQARTDDLELDKTNLSNREYTQNTDYTIVPINSFEESEEYGEYTSWCVTHYENMFNSYTSNGYNQFYFCLKKGFENVEPVEGEGCPLDEYGLSMIAVCVNENGALTTCTCRWNHANGGNDNIMDTEQISDIIGQNFYDVFKPNNKWKDMVDNALQRVKDGENPEDVFEWYEPFSEGYAYVVLNGKYNWIDREGNILSKNQWFDGCWSFKGGYARVILNGKFNFIDREGNILSKNQWFDACGDFYDGYAVVRLNEKRNFIDREGNLLSPNQWFDACWYFDKEGYARVELNRKWNWIDREGNLLSPNQWFDFCGPFINDYGRVELDGKRNFIDREGNIYDINTKEPLGINVKTMNQNESKVGRRNVIRLTESDLRLIIEECIKNVLYS